MYGLNGFLAGMLFTIGIFVLFGLCMLVGYFVIDFNCNFEPKKYLPQPFDPNITEDEQNTLATRFRTFSFDEMPYFMYGLRKIPPRNVQMQFSHKSKCFINVSKDINKKCFKYEVKYKKTVIKTFYDWGEVGDFCWNLNINYSDNPDLVIKKFEMEKREILAAGDF